MDPEGFLRTITVLPDRLVFFDSLSPRLREWKGRYREVLSFEVALI